MKALAAFATSIAVLTVAILAGCSDDDPAKPSPPKEKLGTPGAVLEQLERSYNERSVALYDSIIGDQPVGFVFWFSDDDVQAGEVPPSWGRNDEVASAAHLFTSEQVTSIGLALTYGPSYPDTTAGHEGRRIIDVTDVDLNVVFDGEDPISYRVLGDRARFSFYAHWVDAQGDSIWRIAEWRDLGYAGGKRVPRETWGRLKSLFR